MKKIVVAIPHSHTWFWTQTCIASLVRNPPVANGYECEIVIVDNSPWSPTIRGFRETSLVSDWKLFGGITNHKSNKFHASALDCVVERYNFDYLMALETDVLALCPDWLQWFVNQLKPTDYAVGMFHHEAFVNPSCTLYRGNVLRDMLRWCKNHPDPNVLRWGPEFGKTTPLDANMIAAFEHPDPKIAAWAKAEMEGMKVWIAGPFCEKRGWPAGTLLKESPSGQLKGPGWYEPGQQLHHWAVQQGYTYTVCKTNTHERQPGMPVQTLYGVGLALDKEMSISDMVLHNAQTCHFWGGTRALDIIKHNVTCEFVKSNTPYWLAREARLWKETVPAEVQSQTLDLIRKYGWHYTGQGNDHVTDRDRAAAEFVRQCYREGGVEI